MPRRPDNYALGGFDSSGLTTTPAFQHWRRNPWGALGAPARQRDTEGFWETTGPQSFTRNGQEYSRYGDTGSFYGGNNAHLLNSLIYDPEFGVGLPSNLMKSVRSGSDENWLDRLLGPELALTAVGAVSGFSPLKGLLDSVGITAPGAMPGGGAVAGGGGSSWWDDLTRDFPGVQGLSGTDAIDGEWTGAWDPAELDINHPSGFQASGPGSPITTDPTLFPGFHGLGAAAGAGGTILERLAGDPFGTDETTVPPGNEIPEGGIRTGGGWGIGVNTAAGGLSGLLSRLGINADPSTLETLGRLLGTGLGVAGASRQASGANEASRLARDMFEYERGVRQPWLDRASELRDNPDTWYNSPQGLASTQAAIRGISGGNVFDPGPLSKIAATTHGGYQSALQQAISAAGLGNAATVGQIGNNAVQAGLNASQARGGIFDALGSGISTLFNNQPNMAQLLERYLARG